MKAVPLVLQRIRTATRVIATVSVAGAEVLRLAIPVVRVLVIAVGKLRKG
jgi:hypothetical protein